MNATTLMQGNYAGVAPYLISPLLGAQQAGFEVEYVLGTNVTTTNDTSGFAAAVAAAKRADAVIFAGGLDETVERESLDRLNVTWPGNQLDLVAELGSVGKPLIVAQFGGGQLDDSALKSNRSVRELYILSLPASLSPKHDIFGRGYVHVPIYGSLRARDVVIQTRCFLTTYR